MTPEQMETVRKEREALAELMQAKILRAAYSERQLEEVMVDFWFNHFNVFAGKGQVRVYLTEYERDAIRPHVLGKFRDLLQATAESPAMLFYLDNWQSAAPEGAPTSAPRQQNATVSNPRNPNRVPGRPGTRAAWLSRIGQRTLADTAARPQNQRRGGLNENYARELMELHTLGVDGGYTQKDVQEVARAFTGWTIANPAAGRRLPLRAADARRRREDRCSDTRSRRAAARRTASRCSTSSPATRRPRGSSRRSSRAASSPTSRRRRSSIARPRASARPTATSARSCARSSRRRSSSRAEAYRAKVKTPFEFVVSAVRATGTDMTQRAAARAAMRDLGMPLYGCQPPTGYADKADAWVNTGALLNRMNFAVALTPARQERSARRGIGRCHGQTGGRRPSRATRSWPRRSPASSRSRRRPPSRRRTTSAQALALMLGSPEFQRR